MKKADDAQLRERELEIAARLIVLIAKKDMDAAFMLFWRYVRDPQVKPR